MLFPPILGKRGGFQAGRLTGGWVGGVGRIPGCQRSQGEAEDRQAGSDR